MRPLRLEVQGFTAFRQRTEVDFDGCDFFALTGPTGAGKSSVIDAICFALYGSVPRLGKRQVAPIISQGMLEARVRLDFSVDGDEYTAARVVRRLASGTATTKEARLERAGEVLAGDADSLTEEVKRLLGVGFDDFTTCVVLPQGEFARFLHATVGDRQELLVNLLGVAVYGRMQQRANQMASALDDRVVLDRERLENELAFATKDALAAAEERAAAVEALAERIERERPRLEAVARDIAAAEERAQAAESMLKLLGGLGVPPGTDALARRVDDARGKERAADKEAEDAAAVEERARASHGELPKREELAEVVRAYQERARAAAEVAAEEKALRSLGTAEGKARKAFDAAEQALKVAEDARERARVEHRAADLARALVRGEPCPVCRQVVKTKPKAHEAADLRAAEKAVSVAEAARAKAEDARRRAEADRTAGERGIEKARARIAEIERRLERAPDPEALERDLARLGEAEAASEEARARAGAARKRAAAARTALKDLQSAVKKAWAEFDRARDSLAAVGPPPAEREDLAEEWRRLASWAAAQVPAHESALQEAREAATAAEEQRRGLIAALGEACESRGVAVAGRDLWEAVVEARADARGAADRIRGALEEAERVRARVGAATEEAQVARTLAKYLGAREFEEWLLDEAVGVLVDGATRILYELSGGSYSLALDKHGSFAVLDHRNADEVRSARTLSGGETFLASLALALALSEHLASMAAEGARLDAIFLDEGFGTLDPDALDTVAAAIENLAATGRTVGLVTHVREIAERAPVRFEVRRGSASATVEKVIG